MFGLGMGELLVILAVALLVFGPKRLPELASGLGKAIREFRRATRDLQAQIEVDDSVRRPIHELRAALRDEPPPVTPYVGSTPAPLAMSPSGPTMTAAPTPSVPTAAEPGEAAAGSAALPANEPLSAPVNTPVNAPMNTMDKIA
jgi:TatA/E family protein of Tat protein translocase